MKTKSNRVIVNILLILVIFFSLWLSYVVFIGGPAQVYTEEDRYYLDTIVEYKSLDSAKLINRFALDKVYYIVEIEKDGTNQIAWFDDEFKDYQTHELISFDRVQPLAQENNIEEDKINLGVYEGELIYVLQQKDYSELFVDIDDLEIKLISGGQ